MFTSTDEARLVSEVVPEGPTTTRFVDACAQTGMHAVFGVTERAGNALYNSAVLIGPDGYIGTYRKLHLWDQENRIFSPGDLGLPVFHTALGRIGILICYDLWFPEAVRTLVLGGAQLLCVPTNWVPLPTGNGASGEAMANVLCMASSHINSLPVVAADRCGVERGQEFLGRSIITSHTGWVVAGPAPVDAEAVLTAEIDLDVAERARRWNDFNDPIANRRPNLYASS
jgi:N-carbamoylputrescine amidase